MDETDKDGEKSCTNRVELAKGKFFVQEGAESGPTLYVWNPKFSFDQRILDYLMDISWCRSELDTTTIHHWHEGASSLCRYIAKLYPDNVASWKTEDTGIGGRRQPRMYIELKEPFLIEVDLEWLDGKTGVLLFETVIQEFPAPGGKGGRDGGGQ